MSAARHLAAGGWSVAVFEEHEHVGMPVHCTGVLAEDVVRNLDVSGDVVLNGLSTVRFVAPAGHSFDYTTTTTEAVVIDRAAFDPSRWREHSEPQDLGVPLDGFLEVRDADSGMSQSRDHGFTG